MVKPTLQTHHVDSTMKQRGNDRFHIVSTWNPRVVSVVKNIGETSPSFIPRKTDPNTKFSWKNSKKPLIFTMGKACFLPLEFHFKNQVNVFKSMFFKVIYVITFNWGHFTINSISNLKYGFSAIPSFNGFFLIKKAFKYIV